MNISTRKRWILQGPNLNNSTLDLLMPYILTMKRCLAVCNSIFDIIGKAAPLNISLKIAQKELFAPNMDLGLDTSIPKEEKDSWKIIQVLVETNKVLLPCAAASEGALPEFEDCCLLGWRGQSLLVHDFQSLGN